MKSNQKEKNPMNVCKDCLLGNKLVNNPLKGRWLYWLRLVKHKEEKDKNCLGFVLWQTKECNY